MAIDAVVVLAAAGLVGVTLLGLAGRWHWTLDLFAHQRRVYAVLLAVALLVVLVRRRWGGALVAAAGLAVNLWLIAPLWLAAPQPAAPDATSLRVICFNVNTSNPNHAAVIDYLADSGAHIVALLEVSDGWLADVEAGLTDYEVVAARPRSDNFGIAMLVRRELPAGVALRSAEAVYPDAGDYRLPAIDAALEVDGRELSLLAVHALPPMRPSTAASNRVLLGDVAAWSRGRAEQGRPHIVVGDLNATPWAHAFRELVSDTGLINSQRGFGWGGSWPHRLFRLGLAIPIDHALHSAELTTVDRQLGPTLGSDHRAVEATFAWADGDAAVGSATGAADQGAEGQRAQ